jgi:hypothetical protein
LLGLIKYIITHQSKKLNRIFIQLLTMSPRNIATDKVR